jgi:hypothetical protein
MMQFDSSGIANEFHAPHASGGSESGDHMLRAAGRLFAFLAESPKKCQLR